MTNKYDRLGFDDRPSRADLAFGEKWAGIILLAVLLAGGVLIGSVIALLWRIFG